MALNILYTAHVRATGSHNDHTQTRDGQISHNLSVPRATDGPDKPNTTTSKDLLAAGYAACFGLACDFVAKSMLRLNPSNTEIHCDVGIGTHEKGGSGLKMGLTARISGLSQADARKPVAQAHQVCPYSDATCDNVEVTLRAEVV